MPKGIKGFQKGNKVNLGRTYSMEEREMLSGAHMGHAPSYIAFGVNNHQWRGDNVKYSGLHAWVEKELGKPNKCEHCKTEEVRRYNWANVSRKYKRIKSDWIRLCIPCHKKYDVQ